MSDLGDQAGTQLSSELSNLDVSTRRVLAALSVVGRAPVSVETLREISGVGDARPAVDELDRRRLIVREAGNRVSVSPAIQSRLKRMLATDDEIDAVLGGLIRRGEDGRLEPGDIDALDEATRVASETGRWPQLLRLAQVAEPTLAASQRADEWTRIVERRLEAARALGDEPAAAHARQELDRLAVMSAPTRVMTAETETVAPAPAPTKGTTNWALIILLGLLLAAAGVGLGYLIGDQTSEATTTTQSTPTETETVTTSETVTTTETETVTTTQTETVTTTETETVTLPTPRR